MKYAILVHVVDPASGEIVAEANSIVTDSRRQQLIELILAETDYRVIRFPGVVVVEG